MDNKIVFSGLVISLLFNGCATSNQKANNSHPVNHNTNIKKMQNSNADKYVNVEIQRPVSELLKNLGDIDGKFYHLEGNDTLIPAVKDFTTIKSFNDLDGFIQTTTGKTLLITKNKYVKNGVKSVKVIDKQILAVNNTLESTILHSEVQNLNLKGAISKISSIVGFNVVYSSDMETTTKIDEKVNTKNKANNKNNKKQQPKKEEVKSELLKPSNFKDGTALDFLTYAETYYDIYVDINYNDKIINLSKYKNKEMILQVKTSDLFGVSKTDLRSDLVRDLGQSANQEGIEKYIELQKKLTSLVGNSRNTVKVDISKGKVDIYATRSVSKLLSDEIYKFNSSMEKIEGLSVPYIEEVINDNFKSSEVAYKENLTNLKIADAARIYLYAIERDYSTSIKNNILNYVLQTARANEKIDYEYFEIIMKNQNKIDIKDLINDIEEISSDYKKILLER